MIGMVSREEIRLTYVLLLGREPEDEDAYSAHSTHDDVAAMRDHIVRSEEGVRFLRQTLKDVDAGGVVNFFQPVTIFIHLEKTGGTSLTHILSEHFGPLRSSSSHLNWLPSCSIAELNGYDLVTGHISFQQAMAIPRHPKCIITMFREPTSRLVSLYRFYRSHPEWAEINPLVHLAKYLSAVEFFKHAAVLQSPHVDNAYLRTFCDPPPVSGSLSSNYDLLQVALQRLRTLDCVGILEHLPETVRQIAANLGVPSLPPMPHLNDSKELHFQNRGFTAAESICVSDELRDALTPITEFDAIIYEEANRILESRKA